MDKSVERNVFVLTFAITGGIITWLFHVLPPLLYVPIVVLLALSLIAFILRKQISEYIASSREPAIEELEDVEIEMPKLVSQTTRGHREYA